MFRQLCQLTTAVFMVLLAQDSFAKTYLLKVPLADGKQLNVRSTVSLNERGVREIHFQSGDMARITLGYGRDLDGNGTVETFFLVGDSGMNSYVRTTKGENTWGHAKVVLSKHASYSAKGYYRALFSNVSSFFLMSSQVAVDAQEEYYKEWVDLEEIRIMLDRKKSEISRETYLFALNVLLEGNQMALDKLLKGIGPDIKKWAIADVGMYLSGAVLIKWGGKAVSLVGRRYSPEVKKLATTAAAKAGLRMTLKTYQININAALRALTARTILKKSQAALIAAARGIKAEWKYIAISTGIQVSVESYLNYDEFKDPDPKVVANRLMKSPEVRENVLINLMDTLVMTGVNKTVKNKVARYALLGTVGAGSSVVVGNALDGSQSGERVALDTAWSFGVDTASLVLEMKALHKFESLALKNKNPKLKLIGYGIVVVSQTLGYAGYSAATKYVDPQKDLQQNQIIFVPIVATK
jgi:hypothetical protein